MDPYEYIDDDTGAEFGAEFGASAPALNLDGVIVGIPETSIATGVRVNITVNVTQPFRAERLILNAAGQTALVNIEQISISSKEQNISPGPVPGSVFSADATHRLRGTIVRPGVGIQMTVFNGSAGTIVFGGAFFGPALQG